jgi:alanyl-tRNA synthetase
MKDKEAKFEVINCQSFKGYVLHIGQLEEGHLSVGDEVIVTYDPVSVLFWQGA